MEQIKKLEVAYKAVPVVDDLTILLCEKVDELVERVNQIAKPILVVRINEVSLLHSIQESIVRKFQDQYNIITLYNPNQEMTFELLSVKETMIEDLKKIQKEFQQSLEELKTKQMGRM